MAWRSELGYYFYCSHQFYNLFFVTIYLGGDAVNGKTENGRYYVASHGRYKEVSKDWWTYNRIHTASLFITHPLGMLAAGFLAYASRRRKTTPITKK
jgi:hypothetical protein